MSEATCMDPQQGGPYHSLILPPCCRDLAKTSAASIASSREQSDCGDGSNRGGVGNSDDGGGGSNGGGDSSSSGGGGGIQPSEGPTHASVHFVEAATRSTTQAVLGIPPDGGAAERDSPCSTSPPLSTPLAPTRGPTVEVTHTELPPSGTSTMGGHLTWLDGEADVRRQGSAEALAWEAGFRDSDLAHRVVDMPLQPGAEQSASDSESEDGSVRFAERQRDAAQVRLRHPHCPGPPPPCPALSPKPCAAIT